MRRHIMLDVTFLDCQRVTDLAGVQRFGHLLMQHGFQFVAFPVPGEEGVILKKTEIDDYIARTWRQDALEASARGEQVISWGRRLIASGMEDLQWHFSIELQSGRTAIHLGGLVDFEFRDQRAWVEPYAQRLHSMAHILYPELQPALVSVYEFDARPIFGDVLKRKLKHINWVNIFGLPYVEKYGKEFLLGLPGYKTEELPDGGVFHQLSPTFLVEDEKMARKLRKEVRKHFSQAGLKVICKAPYYLPSVIPAAPAPTIPQVSDEEFRAYLKEMLGVTLTLDDGVRVKPIYIEWDTLTSLQRQMALDAIKAAAIAEIRQHRDKYIRFEFNALPDDLDQMMADLVGQDNPDFGYAQVDMGSC
jgi:hypothetical protein